MVRIKIAFIVGGIMLAYLGYQEWQLSRAAGETPRTISCAELSENGPGDNAHIVLTDFLMCEQSFVYQAKKTDQRWNTVWVPVVPVNGEFHREVLAMLTPDGKLSGPLPKPKEIKVLVKSTYVPNMAQLSALAKRKMMPGLVTNRIESLGQKERQILAQSYPGIDFSRCWIVDHARKPAGFGKIAGLAVGGVFLSMLGGLWMFGGSRARA